MLEDGIAAAIREASVWALPILFAIPLHEAAHGLVAYRLGDDTAYRQGRVTLNPLRHIDPFGTIILPAMLLLADYALPVRLCQAGAGQLQPAAPSAPRHDAGGRRRAGHEHPSGA